MHLKEKLYTLPHFKAFSSSEEPLQGQGQYIYVYQNIFEYYSFYFISTDNSS